MAYLIPNFELAQKIGSSKLEIDASTVDELIREGTARYGDEFANAIKTATIVVNGRSISKLKGGKTRLAPGDNVWLITPSGGG